MLLAAVAYFILPFDFIRHAAGDWFADDAALLAATIDLVSSHITSVSRRRITRLDKEVPTRRDTLEPRSGDRPGLALLHTAI